MRRAKQLLRSTPFRLVLTFGVLFILTFLLSGIITYQLLKSELAEALDSSVVEIYSVVESTYSPDDLEDLITTINNYASLNKSDEHIFSLTDQTSPPMSPATSRRRPCRTGCRR